ncbi:hypothetical protein SAMN05414139_10772 [Burkholderia sp. D7]|nr:hypothetical protein SAMN05414139_10772 [Burkholderia sp. D7]
MKDKLVQRPPNPRGVVGEANDFCAKQNKKVETVALQMTDSGFARPDEQK